MEQKNRNGKKDIINKRCNVDVYQYIYEQISSGAIPMGGSISESEMAGRLQISRSPVREALRKLEGEGIVTRFANRGTFVTEFSLNDIRELYDLRIVLESYGARTAVHNIDDTLLRILEDKFKALNEKSAKEAFHEADQQLHMSMIRASGSKRLEQLYMLLNTQCGILNSISTDGPNDFRESRQEHLNIIHSMQERDLDKLLGCITEHIENRKNNTIRRYLNNWKK